MRILKTSFLSKISIFIFWILAFFVFLFLPLIKREVLNKSINVLTWGSLIDLSTISKFEKETGIKVNLNYYETNDELLSKLQVTKGREYDLITITESALDFFKENNLIKKIDKSKINFMNEIDPHLFGHYFDPNYEYSLPLFWDVFGLGINKKFFDNKLPNQTWGLIFGKKLSPGRVSMTDDATNAVLIAAQYLYGNINNLDQEKLDKIKQLLIDQKKLVEIYTDLRGDYVLKAGICPVVASQGAYIYKIIKHDSNLDFIIPKEGGFKIIDLLIIPRSSDRDEYIYKFINFLYQEKIVRKHFETFGYLPVQKQLLYSINLNYLGGIERLFSPEIFSKLEFFETDISSSKINEIWTAVKA